MDVAEALKSMNPDFKIMAVGSIGLKLEDKKITERLSVKKHKKEGIGDGFILAIFSLYKIDEWVQVYGEEAVGMAKSLTRGKRWFAGILSGANVVAPLKMVKSWVTKELSLQLSGIAHTDKCYSVHIFRDGFV